MNDTWIGLLDCNNFFVSCERLFRPDLLSKPVVVLSSNDGCVVARSQEIKDMGIPMGVPYFQIKDKLKNAGGVTFSSHFALYRDISSRVFSVLKEELQTVEQYSIDEAFFAINDTDRDRLSQIQNIVETKVGIPVSIGVARSKTLAKYAAKMAKKSKHVQVLDMKKWQSIAPGVPLSAIWGVGGRLEMHYKKHGIVTASDLLAIDTARVKQVFGLSGVQLQAELAGQPVHTLLSKRAAQKSLMSSRSFRDTTTDFSVIADAIAYHIRHAAADLRAMEAEALVMRVAIYPSRHGDFLLRGGTKEVVFSAPTSDTFVLLAAAQEALQTIFEAGVPYKKAGITLSSLSPAGSEQASLFATKQKECKTNTSALLQVVDAVNAKEGRELLLLGSRLQTKGWQSRKELCSPAYTTRWNDVQTVLAK